MEGSEQEKSGAIGIVYYLSRLKKQEKKSEIDDIKNSKQIDECVT